MLATLLSCCWPSHALHPPSAPPPSHILPPHTHAVCPSSQYRSLTVMAHGFAAPLPDIEAGALPQLQMLHIDVAELHTTLPASWGNVQAVLPSLRNMKILAHFVGPLPPQWSHGFRRLTSLELIDSSLSPMKLMAQRQTPPAPAATAAGMGALPLEWPSGFPALQVLSLEGLQVQGSLPPEWFEEEGFRSLIDL